jgi:hypothetical protein
MDTKWKLFMQSIIDSSPHINPESDSSPSVKKLTRTVYVRDFGIIRTSSAIWFSTLQAAVQARCMQESEASETCVTQPATIILGLSSKILTEDEEEESQRNRLMDRCAHLGAGRVSHFLPHFYPPAMFLKGASGLSFCGAGRNGYFRRYVVLFRKCWTPI